MVGDVLGRHRAHFLEDLAPLLVEQLVAVIGVASSLRDMNPALLRMLLEKVVSSRVPSTSNAPAGAVSSRSTSTAVHHVAEDEVTVTVFPARCGEVISGLTTKMARAAPVRTALNCHVDGQSGRRAGHIHVEAKALDTQRGVDFNGHGRVGALHVGGRTYQAVHIEWRFAGAGQGVLRGCDARFRPSATGPGQGGPAACGTCAAVEIPDFSIT